MTFGKGGAGSAEGIVERPAGVFSGNSCYLFPSVEQPSQMFIYYYEGNDVEDNLRFSWTRGQRCARWPRQPSFTGPGIGLTSMKRDTAPLAP